MFHGPLGLGFYLLALRPIFIALSGQKYTALLQKKHHREDKLFLILPVLVYIALLRSSVSRAAIGAWIIIAILMIAWHYRSYRIRWKWRIL